RGYSRTLPLVVMRPMLFPTRSVNQRAPSGPLVIPAGQRAGRPPVIPGGSLFPVGIVNSVMLPPVVMRPILSPKASVNQRAPSGPLVIPHGKLFVVGIENSVTLPLVVIRPIFPENFVTAPHG